MEQLRQGRTQNPYLGNFLFDASQARLIKKKVKLKSKDLLLSSANSGQKAAVEMVLAAEDLVLIQGPGTGKTTVIAEICYQVALRGGRTLITSQANLAVDNALSRLIHNPVIRAIRKGKAEKVSEEGQPFLEDQVIGTWLKHTANDCEINLAQRLENVQVFQEILALLPRFLEYLQLEEKCHQEQEEFRNIQLDIETNQEDIKTKYHQDLVVADEFKFLIEGLDKLLNSSKNIRWDSSETRKILSGVQKYIVNHQQVEQFRKNVSQAIKYSEEIGLVPPILGAFGLAVWLKETVLMEIPEFKTVFSSAQDAVLLMTEIATSIQIFQKNSASLNQREKDYQLFLSKQQNLQQLIQTEEKKKQEIDLIINNMKEWKSQAEHRLLPIFHQAKQTSQPLTESMLQLPSGLLKFAGSTNLSILPKNYTLNLLDFPRLENALKYEEEGNFVDRKGNQHSFSSFLEQSLMQIPIIFSENIAPNCWKFTTNLKIINLSIFNSENH